MTLKSNQLEKLIFSQCWRPDDCSQSVSKVSFFCGLSPGLANSCLLAASFHHCLSVDPREGFGIRIVHCFEAEGRVTQLMGTMLGSAKPRSSSLGLSSRVCKCQS